MRRGGGWPPPPRAPGGRDLAVPQGNRSCELVERCGGDAFDHRREGLGGRTGYEQAVPRGDDPLGNRGNLRRGFALSEYHFGEPLAQGPLVVYFREAEVFERALAQILKQPGLRGLRCNSA